DSLCGFHPGRRGHGCADHPGWAWVQPVLFERIRPSQRHRHPGDRSKRDCDPRSRLDPHRHPQQQPDLRSEARAMGTIDIELPEDLRQALTPPKCLDLQLPKPGRTELKLPSGGTIRPIPDIAGGIPTDCSMNFNLALQMAPIMASMECLLKVLKFIGT